MRLKKSFRRRAGEKKGTLTLLIGDGVLSVLFIGYRESFSVVSVVCHVS